MDIRQYAAALIQRIESARPRADISNEAAFEQAHVVAPAWALARTAPEIRVFTHPSNRLATCSPDCDSAAACFTSRVEGCPRCWAASKALSVVDAFGTRKNFDLVAVDQAEASLAVEVKWLSASTGKGPNAEFQRFVGQCVLAAATNDVVIGICGFRGDPSPRIPSDPELRGRSRTRATHRAPLRPRRPPGESSAEALKTAILLMERNPFLLVVRHVGALGHTLVPAVKFAALLHVEGEQLVDDPFDLGLDLHDAR
jgi:hypothetical protein